MFGCTFKSHTNPSFSLQGNEWKAEIMFSQSSSFFFSSFNIHSSTYKPFPHAHNVCGHWQLYTVFRNCIWPLIPSIYTFRSIAYHHWLLAYTHLETLHLAVESLWSFVNSKAPIHTISFVVQCWFQLWKG